MSSLVHLNRRQTIAAPLLLFSVSVATLWSLSFAASRPLRAVVVPALSAALLSALGNVAPLVVEDFLNHARVPLHPDYVRNATVSPLRFRVADLHCDALLWAGRDIASTAMHPLISGRAIGHVDLPRLKTGNVRLQVFAVSFFLVCLCLQTGFPT